MLIVDVINHVLLVVVKWIVISVVIMTLVEKSRNTSAATLHIVLMAGLYSIALLSIVSLYVPSLAIPILSPSLSSKFEIPQSVYAVDLLWVGLLIYCLVFLTLCAKLLLGVISVLRIGQRSVDLGRNPHRSLLDTALQFVGVHRSVILKYSVEIDGPITYGVFRPVILLPEESRHWSSERVQRFLLHEVAHIKRFDWFWKMQAQLLCALFWFVPTGWGMLRRIEWLAELSCDDVVLKAENASTDYADDLLEMAVALTRPPAGAVALMEVSEHYRRIASVLDGSRLRAVNKVTLSLYVGVIVLVTSVVGAVQFGFSANTQSVTTFNTARQQSRLLLLMNESSQPFRFRGVDSVDGIESTVMTKLELNALKADLLPERRALDAY